MKRTARLLTIIAIMWIAIACRGFAADTHLPLVFESNEGQWNDEVRFLARSRAGIVALERRGAVLIPAASSAPTLRMEIVGGRTQPLIEGADPLPQTTNYFFGADPSTWRRGIRSYRRVVYRGVYRGIDAVFHSGRSGELEYDFVVSPGSDPRMIRLRFDGAASVALDRGELVIGTGVDRVRMARPVAYQGDGADRKYVTVRYRLLEKRSVGFLVGKYDGSKPLIIDPVVAGYSTFLGGSGSDSATSIAVDADRNVYIAGNTMSADFVTKGGVRGVLAGGRDAFVTKLNPTGNEIVFSTFLGGSRDESGSPSIAVDSRGDVYLSGTTSSPDFPTTEGAPQRTFGGGASDAYVVKLSADGARLLFSTFLGGEEGDPANGLAIDAARDVYIGGATSSTRFPVTPQAFQAALRGSRNAYAARLRVDPPSLVYATYLGGSAETIGRRIAVDAASAAILVGRTLASDFPTTPGAFQTTFGGIGLEFGDGFVTKIDPDGSSLLYSTYLGGESGESLEGIAVDATGAAHVTGLTYSRNLPTTEGSYQPQHGGGDADNFVAKLAPEGDRLIFSTYLGGNNSDQANAIAVDRLGNIHVSGTTSAADFPTTVDAMSRTRKGENDAFVSSISRDGSKLLYSTYVGGTAPSGGPQDNLWAMALDAAANIYITGQTRSTDFPITPGAVQSAHKGMDDAYVMKLAQGWDRPEGESLVVPVVGSTPGALGSFFKTSFQLHNARAATIGGRLIFHAQGRSGSDADPSLDYFLSPGETMTISDLLPAMAQSGLGSIDLVTKRGEMPESVIRIFNDAGEAGTTGMSEEPVREGEILRGGMTGILIAPLSTTRSRFNIGIRTLAAGASLEITLRHRDGGVAHVTTKTYQANFFEQRNAAELVGTALQADDTIALRVIAGSAAVYGSTIDNTTQDPSLQLARTPDSVSGETRILPVVGSTPGAFGSFFKTAIQLHNPATAIISGKLVYHPQGVAGSVADPSLEYMLQPGETISFDDLLPAMGLSGLGSADIVSTAGPLPISVVRIFNDAGDGGTTGMTEDQVPMADVLREGDEGVVIAPPHPEKARLNIGIRTLSEGATITATLRNSFGNVVKSVTKTFPPVFFTQISAPAFMEAALLGSDTIRFRVGSGAAILYGATTDNISQDPMLRLVRRLE